MKDGTPVVCPACGAEDFRFIYRGNIGREIGERFSQYAFFDDIFRCGQCGLLAQKQSRNTADIITLLTAEKYLDETIGHLNLAEKDRHFAMLLSRMRRYCTFTGKQILDVGANTGVFLNMLRNETPHLYGIEPSSEAAAAARERFGLNVEGAVIQTATLPASTYDVMTMFDVVEHLTDPVADFTALRQSLRPGGRIFITTHNIDTIYARILGKRYPLLMYQHFYHYSPRTLRLMLEKVGYRIIANEHFCKSWSIAYIHELFGKVWPNHALAKAAQAMTRPLLRSDWMRRRRIVWPVRENFMCIAERI